MTTTSRVFRGLSLVSVAGLIVSCGLLKKGGDADASAEAAVAEVAPVAAEAGPVVPVAVPVAAAANVDDVARFPDEKAIDNVAAPIQRVTNVRDIPNIGKVVATLQKGATVTQLASRTTFFLVSFDSAGKRLMGWVPQDAFAAAPVLDASVRLLTCAAPDVPLITDAPFCGRICSTDADCPANLACRGAANRFTNNRFGDAVTVCATVAQPKVNPTVVDAGPPPPPPPPPPVAKCPAGQVFVAQDKACHVAGCKIGGCPAATPLCIQCSGSLICVSVAQRLLCK